MKATLRFTLPEEADWFRQATQAQGAFNALEELRREIRDKLKYAELSKAERDAWEKLSVIFWECIRTYRVGLEE